MPGDDDYVDVLKKSSGTDSCLCGLNHLFKRARPHVTVNKHPEEEEEKIEENTEEGKLKQREEINSATVHFPDSSSIISLQLRDLLVGFASLKGSLQSLARDLAELKAETLLLYSGRVNDHHTHFTSPPMTSSSFFDQDDYYTSCHYANSHHRR